MVAKAFACSQKNSDGTMYNFSFNKEFLHPRPFEFKRKKKIRPWAPSNRVKPSGGSLSICLSFPQLDLKKSPT